MALIVYRVMRTRLRASANPLSPERALDKLRRIQHHQATLNNTQAVTGLSFINQEHVGNVPATEQALRQRLAGMLAFMDDIKQRFPRWIIFTESCAGRGGCYCFYSCMRAYSLG